MWDCAVLGRLPATCKVRVTSNQLKSTEKLKTYTTDTNDKEAETKLVWRSTGTNQDNCTNECVISSVVFPIPGKALKLDVVEMGSGKLSKILEGLFVKLRIKSIS